MLGKPNVVLPLTPAYDERGFAGATSVFGNPRLDQQKINCFYEVIKPVNGPGKIFLSKRVGSEINTTTFGVSSQISHLVSEPPVSSTFSTGFSNNPWVFATNGTTLTVSNNSTTFTIFGSTDYASAGFIDKTAISGIDTILVQYRKLVNPGPSRVFFNNSSQSISSWSEITHTNFTSLTHFGKLEPMDGFAFQLASDNFIYNSSTNTIASWGAIDRLAKQIKQDSPVGLARLNNQILAFGNETFEAFYNAGNPTGSPLSPIRQLHNKVGLVTTPIGTGGTHYYCIIRNTMFFVGRQAGGNSMGVFAYNGSYFEKVSSEAIDKILLDQGSIFSVNSLGFNGNAAVAIGLSIPGQAQRWLMFLPEWKDWFEWNSNVFSPVNNGKFFIGNSPLTNKVFSLPASTWQDAGTSYTMQTQFKLPNDGSPHKKMAAYGVQADTARWADTLDVAFTDDDFQSTTSAGTIPLNVAEKTLSRGGAYYDRGVILTNSSSTEVRLSSFNAWVSEK